MLLQEAPGNQNTETGAFAPAEFENFAVLTPQWRLVHPVITSYSIHYTKLYERDRNLSKKHRVATLINRGILFNHQGAYVAAIADFEAALALDPAASAAYVIV